MKTQCLCRKGGWHPDCPVHGRTNPTKWYAGGLIFTLVVLCASAPLFLGGWGALGLVGLVVIAATPVGKR